MGQQKKRQNIAGNVSQKILFPVNLDTRALSQLTSLSRSDANSIAVLSGQLTLATTESYKWDTMWSR